MRARRFGSDLIASFITEHPGNRRGAGRQSRSARRASLIRWQPQSGCACLSIRIVRRVTSDNRLPVRAARLVHQPLGATLLEQLLPFI